MVSSPSLVCGGVQEAGEDGLSPESVALSTRGLVDSYGSQSSLALDGADDEEHRDLVFVECPLLAQLEAMKIDRDAWRGTALVQACQMASLWMEVCALRDHIALQEEAVKFALMEGDNAKAYSKALAQEMIKLCRKPEANDKDTDATSSPDKALHVVAEIGEKAILR